jgi:predicted DNA-binding transcriptional regulator YafY
MGKRSAIESVVGIVGAFLDQRIWKQADLARHLELQPRALRKHLDEMVIRGFPLEKEDEPPQVYWSMRKDWFPGGLLLQGADIDLFLRLLCQAPTSEARTRLLERISSALPQKAPQIDQLQSVLEPKSGEEPFVALVTQAAAERQALHLRYYTTTRGVLEWRHISVERVLAGPPARMVARCHRASRLKWFRIDNIASARLDPDVPFQATPPNTVEQLLGKSLDGFAGEDPPEEHRFFVPEPDARWVQKNLLAPMVAENVAGGVRVTCNTAAPLRLARFVLSFAPSARAETPNLTALVAELAEGVLAAHQRAKKLDGRRTKIDGRQSKADGRRRNTAEAGD